MTKQSVMTSCADTSMTTTSSASLAEAARAAVVAILTSSSVPVFRRDRLGGVELALGHVLNDAVGHQVPDRPVGFRTLAAVGRRDRQRGHLDESQRIGWQLRECRLDVLAVELVARAADADES